MNRAELTRHLGLPPELSMWLDTEVLRRVVSRGLEAFAAHRELDAGCRAGVYAHGVDEVDEERFVWQAQALCCGCGALVAEFSGEFEYAGMRVSVRFGDDGVG